MFLMKRLYAFQDECGMSCRLLEKDDMLRNAMQTWKVDFFTKSSKILESGVLDSILMESSAISRPIFVAWITTHLFNVPEDI